MRQREQAELFLQKAAEDQKLLEAVIDADISDEIFGFHAQQAAEKLFKALLSVNQVRFRKTHDLRELMDLLEDSGNPVPKELSDADRLTPYGTLFRYAAMDGEAGFDRKEAMQMVRAVRKWVEAQVRGSS